MIKKIKKFFHTKDGVEQQEINKQLLITFVSIFITVVSVIGVSMAAFVWSDNSEKEQNIAVGNVALTINSNSAPLGSGLNYPVNDADVNSLEPYTFTITNNGSLAANYTLKLVDDSAAITSDGCTNNQIDKNYVYANLSGAKTTSNTSLTNFMSTSIDTGVLTPGQTKTYNLRLWIYQTAPNSVIGGHFHGKIQLETSQVEGAEPVPTFVDTSGANEPVLADGMIPVVYNAIKEVWVRADTEAGWYAYQDQVWANAVTVTSTNRSKYASDSHIGKEIPMDEINSMWVWIPRFKYNIPSDLGSSSAITNPPQINVTFETGTNTTGVTETVYRSGISAGATNTLYYTHPAFRNVSNITYGSSTTSRGAWDEEITGFWVSKFFAGTTNEACNTSGSETNCLDVELVVKPNTNGVVYQSISTQFKHSLKFAGGTMDETTGEVTFTANANNIYGLNTTSATTDTHMMKNTEWGAVAILSQSQYGKMGNGMYSGVYKEIYHQYKGAPPSLATNSTYLYNDITDRGSGTGAAGAGSSTTGTIYGVYDMNGYWSFLMANDANTTGSSGFTTFPNSKYYDLYSGTGTMTKEKTILGDVIWETTYWYSTTNSQPNGRWVARGGYAIQNGQSGIFGTSSILGQATYYYNWRPVLMP